MKLLISISLFPSQLRCEYYFHKMIIIGSVFFGFRSMTICYSEPEIPIRGQQASIKIIDIVCLAWYLGKVNSSWLSQVCSLEVLTQTRANMTGSPVARPPAPRRGWPRPRIACRRRPSSASAQPRPWFVKIVKIVNIVKIVKINILS